MRTSNESRRQAELPARVRFDVSRSSFASLSFSLAALFLMVPAYTLPFLKLSTWDGLHEATVLGGVEDLWKSGSEFVAAVVLLASVVIPVAKTLSLLYLSLLKTLGGREQRVERQMHLTIELIGRWSMLDIFLATILVGVIKLSDFGRVSFGPAVPFFCVVIFLTMLSSELVGALNVSKPDERNL